MAAPRCLVFCGTLTPFLYPSIPTTAIRHTLPKRQFLPPRISSHRKITTTTSESSISTDPPLPPPTIPSNAATTTPEPITDSSPYDTPSLISPEDYHKTPFTDSLILRLSSGPGGHGCTSFLREKYVSAGPPNGGDGGRGGSVYIRAITGLTSLHKLAHRGAGMMKAGRGKSGRGSGRGGERGENVILDVPVGTVVREIARFDPAAELEGSEVDTAQAERAKFILWPGLSSTDRNSVDLPSLEGRRRNTIPQPLAPINLDLLEPTQSPILLAAGAAGGLGNTHFVSRERPRPNFATKGEEGMQITVSLELKILADVGLVGFPNAGKSTFLRSISRSRARVGGWAFTTLKPGIGTVVLDDLSGRAKVPGVGRRERFTVADIPGLVVGASQGLGMGGKFLRHVERAGVLGFVVDLSGGQGDPVTTVEALWRELRAYEAQRGVGTVQWKPMLTAEEARHMVVDGGVRGVSQTAAVRISDKPWFVVGTKADLPSSQENFQNLQAWLKERQPGNGDGWKGEVAAFPVSAIRGEGVDKIIEWTAGLLEREGK